jgi:hypothetical protein
MMFDFAINSDNFSYSFEQINSARCVQVNCEPLYESLLLGLQISKKMMGQQRPEICTCACKSIPLNLNRFADWGGVLLRWLFFLLTSLQRQAATKITSK